MAAGGVKAASRFSGVALTAVSLGLSLARVDEIFVDMFESPRDIQDHYGRI